MICRKKWNEIKVLSVEQSLQNHKLRHSSDVAWISASSFFLDESSISSISHNFRISMPYVWHICRISYSQQQSVAKQPFDEKIVVFSFALFVMIKFEFFRKIITSNLFNRKYASLEKNYNIILTLYIKWVLLMSSNITNIRNRSRRKRISCLSRTDSQTHVWMLNIHLIYGPLYLDNKTHWKLKRSLSNETNGEEESNTHRSRDRKRAKQIEWKISH